jgi:hypothetical protein
VAMVLFLFTSFIEMRYFAKLINNIVDKVITLNDDMDFADLNLDGQWIETFKDGQRGRFAGKGMSYCDAKDCFHRSSPFPSWILGIDGKWSAPIDQPSLNHDWDEESLTWIERT